MFTINKRPKSNRDAHKTTNILLEYAGDHARKIEWGSEINFEFGLIKIFERLADAEPLEIVLPGFPYKSANTGDKVMGDLPDLGELEALKTLNKLCKEIERKIGRKTKMIICSDGFAFNDFKGVSDENVIAYREELKKMARPFDITIKSLHEFDPSDAPAVVKRANLMHEFGRSIEEIKREMESSSSKRILYTGLKAFAENDLMRIDGESGKVFRRRCSATAFNVMARSEAWAGLIKHHHPNALRLTIHPYTNVSDKFPIMLVPSMDGRWRTPWHNCPVIDGSTPFTVKVKLAPRKALNETDARLNMKENRPWSYTSEETVLMENAMLYAMG